MTPERYMITELTKAQESAAAVQLEACTIIHDLSKRVADLEGAVAYLEARMIAKS